MLQNFEIKIGVIGGVSVGKSTLLNAIFGNSFSEMNIKRTTFFPQKYHTTNDSKLDEENMNKHIKENNKKMNKFFINEWDGKTVADYQISLPKDFININDNYSLCIYDLPGINDMNQKKIYEKWLEENISNFDIILYIVDIYSGLNTSDEVEILNLILKFISPNTHMICCINKCDLQTYDEQNNKFEMNDDELDEIAKTQIIPTIQQSVFNMGNTKIVNDQGYLKNRLWITYLSSKNAFLYRTIQLSRDINDIYNRLSEKDVESLMIDEMGKARWNKISKNKIKRKECIIEKIDELIKDTEGIKISLQNSGFDMLTKIIARILMKDKFILDYHMKNTNIKSLPLDILPNMDETSITCALRERHKKSMSPIDLSNTKSISPIKYEFSSSIIFRLQLIYQDLFYGSKIKNFIKDDRKNYRKYILNNIISSWNINNESNSFFNSSQSFLVDSSVTSENFTIKIRDLDNIILQITKIYKSKKFKTLFIDYFNSNLLKLNLDITNFTKILDDNLSYFVKNKELISDVIFSEYKFLNWPSDIQEYYLYLKKIYDNKLITTEQFYLMLFEKFDNLFKVNFDILEAHYENSIIKLKNFPFNESSSINEAIKNNYYTLLAIKEIIKSKWLKEGKTNIYQQSLYYSFKDYLEGRNIRSNLRDKCTSEYLKLFSYLSEYKNDNIIASILNIVDNNDVDKKESVSSQTLSISDTSYANNININISKNKDNEETESFGSEEETDTESDEDDDTEKDEKTNIVDSKENKKGSAWGFGLF